MPTKQSGAKPPTASKKVVGISYTKADIEEYIPKVIAARSNQDKYGKPKVPKDPPKSFTGTMGRCHKFARTGHLYYVHDDGRLYQGLVGDDQTLVDIVLKPSCDIGKPRFTLTKDSDLDHEEAKKYLFRQFAFDAFQGGTLVRELEAVVEGGGKAEMEQFFKKLHSVLYVRFDMAPKTFTEDWNLTAFLRTARAYAEVFGTQYFRDVGGNESAVMDKLVVYVHRQEDLLDHVIRDFEMKFDKNNDYFKAVDTDMDSIKKTMKRFGKEQKDLFFNFKKQIGDHDSRLQKLETTVVELGTTVVEHGNRIGGLEDTQRSMQDTQRSIQKQIHRLSLSANHPATKDAMVLSDGSDDDDDRESRPKPSLADRPFDMKKVGKAVEEELMAEEVDAFVKYMDGKYFDKKLLPNLAGKNFQTLLPEEWADDKIMEGMMRLFYARDRRMGGRPKKFVSPIWYTFASQGSPSSVSSFSVELVEGWADWDEQTMEWDGQVFVIIHVFESHWISAMIDFDEEIIQMYDPLGQKHYNVMKNLKTFVGHQLGKQLDGWHFRQTRDEYPRQENGYDCGIFVCMFVYFMSLNQACAFDQEWVTQHGRSFIGVSLLREFVE